MRPADPIQDLFKQANYPADADQNERILGDALDVIAQRATTPQVRKRPSRWRRIMTSRTTQLSAAAVVLLALGLFFANLNNTPVYGMSEVPGLYKLARTLHFKGTQYFPENNCSDSCLIESWIDLDNNRWRTFSPNILASNGAMTISPGEVVYDGNGIRSYIDHTEKQVHYYTLSPLQQSLEQRKQIRKYNTMVFGAFDQFDHCQIIDHEAIDGIGYEVWEAVVTQHFFTYKTNAWLDPATGTLLKSKRWLQSSDGTWLLSREMQLIQRDVEIPESIFNVDIPDGYEALATPETAPEQSMFRATISSSDALLTEYLLFSLPDGSLIACWSSKKKDHSDSQTDLFVDCQPGGVFPELPSKLHQFKALMEGREIVFSGCHLTATQKEGQYYEWGLYTSSEGLAC